VYVCFYSLAINVVDVFFSFDLWVFCFLICCGEVKVTEFLVCGQIIVYWSVECGGRFDHYSLSQLLCCFLSIVLFV
jgi:hypothetical protein